MSAPLTLLYTPCASAEEAKTIANTLLEEKLIACANIVGTGTSLYHWDGQLAESTETYLICKTTQALARKASERLAELHSYDCPAILTLPATANTAFASWVATQTR